MYFHPAEKFFQKVLDSETELAYFVLVNGEQDRQAPRFRSPLSFMEVLTMSRQESLDRLARLYCAIRHGHAAAPADARISMIYPVVSYMAAALLDGGRRMDAEALAAWNTGHDYPLFQKMGHVAAWLYGRIDWTDLSPMAMTLREVAYATDSYNAPYEPDELDDPDLADIVTYLEQAARLCLPPSAWSGNCAACAYVDDCRAIHAKREQAKPARPRPHIRAIAAAALTKVDAVELAKRYDCPPALVVSLFHEIEGIRERRYNMRQRVNLVSGKAFYKKYGTRWPDDTMAHKALMAAIHQGVTAQDFLRRWRNGSR